MVKVHVKKSYFEKLIQERIEDEQSLIDLLHYGLGLEPEELSEEEYVFSVTPNRPDLYSVIAIARAYRQYTEKEPGLRIYRPLDSEYKAYVDAGLINLRPWTALAVVKDLEITEDLLEEIIQTQELLAENYGRKRRKFSIGFYPLKDIEFPLKYCLLEPEKIRFVPLDFDEELNAKEILEKHPKGQEYGHIIENWSKYPVFMDNKGDVLSLVPIINSETHGKLKPGDREFLIDVTGVNEYAVEKTLNILCSSLADVGGKIYKVEVIYPNQRKTTPNMEPGSITAPKDKVLKFAGLNLDDKTIERLLSKLGLDAKVQGNEIYVKYPCYRVDIFSYRDIAEELFLGYGITNYELETPNIYTKGGLLPQTGIVNAIRRLLIGLGFDEVMTFALTNLDKQYRLINEKVPENVPIIEDAVHKKINTIRQRIFPELLEFVYSNKGQDLPIKLFDIDYVVVYDESKANVYKNKLNLAIVVYDTEVSYTQIKQITDYLSDRLDIGLAYEEAEYPFLIEGRAANLLLNGKVVGFLGELRPDVVENFRLENPVVVAELSLSDIFNLDL